MPAGTTARGGRRSARTRTTAFPIWGPKSRRRVRKRVAFILSGTLAGFAGSLKVFVAQNASLTDVHWSMSGEVVLMTLVGGMGTVFGPIFGALVIVAMENYLATLGAWVTIVQGIVFVFCVLLFREGIVGLFARWLKQPL